MRQLGADVALECFEATRPKPLDILVERVDEHPERQIALEFRCRPGQNQVALHVGPSPKLFEQASLAHSGLTQKGKRARPPPFQLAEGIIERTARLGAPNELLACRGHFRPWRA